MFAQAHDKAAAKRKKLASEALLFPSVVWFLQEKNEADKRLFQLIRGFNWVDYITASKEGTIGIKQLSEGEQKHLEVKCGAFLKRSINQRA